MPKRAVPQSFVAGRIFTLGATTYQPGDVVPNAVVKAAVHLSRLIAGGYLVPTPDVYARAAGVRGGYRNPTSTSTVERIAVP